MNLNLFARRASPTPLSVIAASTGVRKPRFKGVLLSAALLSTALLVMTSPFVALAEVCATPGKDGSTFNPNSYYPAAAGTSAASGTFSISLGTKRATPTSNDLAAGDLVLIVQMQDALINNSDSGSYGDGISGRGYTSLRSAGYYEFNVVSAITGTTLTLKNALANTYTNANASTSTGQRRFQIVRVPQFSTLTLASDISVPAWDGTSGGVFALNVAGTLNFNGKTIDASNAGFRGGGSRQDDVVSGQKIVNYATPYSTTVANYGAFKGEGIAGTPRFVRDLTKTSVAYTGTDLGISGYPTGTVTLGVTGTTASVTGGLDRSRGAPGNAGGGGDQHNAGGGGGSNVGAGGTGGNSFAFYRNPASGTCVTFSGTFNACDGDGARDVGGLGGVGISPASLYPNAERLIVGGGGGAGDNNNATDDNPTIPQGSGGNGGGVIFVVANTITGTGILRANGQNGQPAGRDAAGGGGAGGTVAIATNTNNLSGLSIQVNGGSGGNSALPLKGGETQGPGGGGGGGAVLLTTNVTTPPGVGFLGGAAGVNNPVAGVTNVYGGSAGVGGKGDIVYNNNAIPRTPFCFPQLTVTKVTTTPQLLNTPSSTQTPAYRITITNAPNVGAANGVQVVDALPTPFTYAGPTVYTPSGTSVTRPTSSDPAASATALTWSSFVIPGGQSVTLDFPINRLQGVGTFQNSASVSFLDPTDSSGTRLVSPGATYTGGGTVAGSNYASTSSTAEDITIESDLQVTKQALKTGTAIAQTTRTNTQSFDYLITVTNLKAVNATNVTVTDANFPSTVTPGTATIVATPATPATGAAFDPVTKKLTVSALAAGQSVSVRIPVTVNLNALTAAATSNTATLTVSAPVDDGTNGSVTANNTQTVTTYFNPVQLKKYVRNVTASETTDTTRTTTTAKPLDKLEYCVQATSLLTTALSVNVSDPLQPNQTFVAGSITNTTGTPVGSYASNTVSGTLQGISASQSGTLCFQTTVN
ncbi:hypothetical protein EHF33_07090 [Deinococcus psychrotolerans]|uniref:DUF11 domain-containing protein n=1 Tax=Deinococcus psychrotolerans TaxID=2489213 RepID=A0A3G8YB57_9DEIO|nr:DUF11 domain-containing protein [Deinococcus psychrotolerans]AZI42538.1 hypothetical protein EHF33_07090 [Deinococcus psychrotolerans]